MRSGHHSRSAVVARVGLLGVLAGGWLLVVSCEVSLSGPALSPSVSAVAAGAGSPLPHPTIHLGGVLPPLIDEAPPGLSLAIITQLPEAREVVQTERQRTITERDAFQRFKQRVAALDPSPPSSDATSQVQGPPRVMTSNTNPASSSATDGLDAVQQAYRETVMSVSHYDQEYDEPLGVNMAAEFGDDLAVAIIDNPQLTPYLQQTVVQAATAASTRRDEFITRLDAEHATLEDAHQTLTHVADQYKHVTAQPRYHQSSAELEETHQQLTTCISTCEQLLDERQTQRVEGHTAEPHTDELVDLHHYLYQSLDVTYPVLADGTTLLDRCSTARHRVTDDLARRF